MSGVLNFIFISRINLRIKSEQNPASSNKEIQIFEQIF